MTAQIVTSHTGARDNYDGISRVNHWLTAFAMIAMLCFGFYLAWIAEPGPQKGAIVQIHKACGVLVFLFVLWRVGYRLAQGFKPDAAPMPPWQEIAARTVHWVLIAGMVLMPVSGMLGSYFSGRSTNVFGLFTIPSGPEVKLISGPAHELHAIIAWVLVIAIAAHVAGALKHHLIDRDTTLLRMLGRA